MTGPAAGELSPRAIRAAHRLLSDIATPDRDGFLGSPEQDADERTVAAELLVLLDYARPGRGKTDMTPTSCDAATVANRLGLLALAGRLERVFRLPMPHAPGAEFIGAMVRPVGFGLAGHDAAGAGGRGVSIRRAFESCMGEAAEYLSFLERGDEGLVGGTGAPPGLDDDELEWAAAGLGLDDAAQLAGHDMLEGFSMTDGRTVHLPSELVIRRPSRRRRAARPAESTGLAAGPTLEAALLGGLLEAVERDAAALWWYGRREARAVHPAVTGDPAFRRFAGAVRDGGRPWWLLDITTDIPVPVVAALSTEPDGTSVVAGFAAGLDPAAAASSALLEMSQMELAQEISLARLARYGEERLDAQDRLWVARQRSLSLASVPRLNRCRPAGDKPQANHPSLQSVLASLRDRGFDAYAVDLTRRELAIPVVHVLVPGLQSTGPDWISRRLAVCAGANGHPLESLAASVAPI